MSCCVVEVLTLQANAFTGTIASDIGTLSNLKQFQVGLTQVHGTIPSEIGQCTKLQSLHLTRNSLTGTVCTTHCCVLWRKTRLCAHHFTCSLWIQIPSEIGNLVILRTFPMAKTKNFVWRQTQYSRIIRLLLVLFFRYHGCG